MIPLPGTVSPFAASQELPVGSVIAYAGRVGKPGAVWKKPGDPLDVTPPGWLLCDGSPVTQAHYPELYAAIGDLYGGSGDSFNLPDYQGYFLRGLSPEANPERDPDSRTAPANGSERDPGSTQEDAFQQHQHDYLGSAIPVLPNPEGDSPPFGADGAPPYTQTVEVPQPMTPGGTVKSSPNESRAQNIYVNYLIKATTLTGAPTTLTGRPSPGPIR